MDIILLTVFHTYIGVVTQVTEITTVDNHTYIHATLNKSCGCLLLTVFHTYVGVVTQVTEITTVDNNTYIHGALNKSWRLLLLTVSTHGTL